MPAASSHTDSGNGPTVTLSHETINRMVADWVRKRSEVLTPPQNSQSKTNTGTLETKPRDGRVGLAPHRMTSAQSGPPPPTPTTCSVMTDKIRVTVDQLLRDFVTMRLSEFYKPESWPDTVLRDNDEKLYVLTGLHYMTETYKVKVSLDGPRYLYTHWRDASNGVKCSNSETSQRDHQLYYVYAGKQWFLDPKDSWFLPGWTCGFETKLSRNTRIELDHVIWSCYSWCCVDQGKEEIDMSTLLTWMDKHQSVLEKPCRSLRNKVRFEHNALRSKGADPPSVCSTTDVKSSEDGPQLIAEVFTRRLDPA